MICLTNYILEYNMGDWSSVIGLIATLIGFFITIWNVWRTKSAVEKAQGMVEKVRDDMKRIDTISEFSSAINSIEEIKRLQLIKAWAILPDRYGSLIKQLIRVKGTSPDLK